MSRANFPGIRCTSLLLYCRAGFEAECAKEIAAACGALHVDGFVRSKPGSGVVEYVAHDAAEGARLVDGVRYDTLVFARQIVFGVAGIRELPAGDRVGALMP